jgi:alpha-L-fucosidase
MDFLKAQVRELCTNYGDIHGFWWDMNVPKHRDPSVNAMIRELQPNAVINNRGFDEGDFGTPERDYEKDVAAGFDRPTEACQSVGMESWGYKADEDYYTDRHLMVSIDRYLARDANYLLNVGPTGEGLIAERSAAILRRIGSWLDAVKEAFDTTVPAPGLVANPNVVVTRRDNTLYVHIPPTIPGDGVKLKPIQAEPACAVLLNDGRAVDWAVDLLPSDHVEHKPYLRLRRLPVNEMANTVLVVKLDFDRDITTAQGVGSETDMSRR